MYVRECGKVKNRKLGPRSIFEGLPSFKEHNTCLFENLVFSFNVAKTSNLASLTMASRYGHVSIQFSLV